MIELIKRIFGAIMALFSKKEKPEQESTIIGGRKPMKKALLVGINKYRADLNSDLQGCVNDVQNMRSILVNTYKFDPENIRVIADDRATRQNILDRLNWLLKDAVAGDELVFHYSGHGSQCRDRNGDELNDHLDEILCPHDLDWNNPLTDDVLGSMFTKIPAEVNLTMICDSCHSGTMTRGTIGNPHPVKARLIPPPFDIMSRSMDIKLEKKKIGTSKRSDGAQRHVLISGCRDDQTSADAYIGNKYQGAFTNALSRAIGENPNYTYKKAHKVAGKHLAGKFTQVPQLSGDADLLNRPLFGGTK